MDTDTRCGYMSLDPHLQDWSPAHGRPSKRRRSYRHLSGAALPTALYPTRSRVRIRLFLLRATERMVAMR